MTFPDQTTDADRQLAAYISRLESRISKLESGFVLPVLDDDPEADDPTNLWLLNDGRLRGRAANGTIYEWRPHTTPFVPTVTSDPSVASNIKLWFMANGQLRGRLSDNTIVNVSASAGAAAPVSPAPPPTTAIPKPPVQVVQQYRKYYTSDEATCYCASHGTESALYYGRFSSSAHGERRVMFGFNDALIRADLAGATIRSVQMRVKNLHSWPNSGVEIYWGAHNIAALGSSFSQSFAPFYHAHWPKVGGDVWRSMGSAGLWIGQAFRDNRIKGLTIDQPSTSNSFYGQIHAGLDLAITYTK